MNGYHAFGCENALANTTPTFKNGLWTVICPTCGVASKLAPDPGRKDGFIVTGAFYSTERTRQPSL